MIKYFGQIYLGALFLTTISACNIIKPTSTESDVKFNMANLQKDNDYIFYKNKTLTVNALTKEITENRDKNHIQANDISNEQMATYLIDVCTKFKIDCFVFTGLIKHESKNYWQHAESPTGAEGLSQMTSIAMEEINGQFGCDGFTDNKDRPIVVKESAIYLKAMLQNDFGLSPDKLCTKAFDSNYFKQNPKTALVYGAILFKALLAVNYNKYGSGNKKLFTVALTRYNGDLSDYASLVWPKIEALVKNN